MMCMHKVCLYASVIYNLSIRIKYFQIELRVKTQRMVITILIKQPLPQVLYMYLRITDKAHF